MRIDALQGPACDGLHWHVVDYVQGLVAFVERADPADADREAPVVRPCHDHAGEFVHQHLLDRLAGVALDVLRRHCRSWHGGRRWDLFARGALAVGASGDPEEQREESHRVSGAHG